MHVASGNARKLSGVQSSEVGQPMVLQVRPEELYRIQVWSIGWQEYRSDPVLSLKPYSQRSCSMHV